MRYLSVSLFMMGLVSAGCGQSSQDLQELDAGSYSEAPERVSIAVNNYKPKDGFVLEHMYVSNYSVQVKQGRLEYSSSRDGLSDSLKMALAPEYGFTTYGPETGGTGYSDLLLYLAGITLKHQSNIYCHQMGSTVQDGLSYRDTRQPNAPWQYLGLRDCEKDYLGLNRFSFDSDGDGIPDYLELRCGLNPANPNDALASTAGDGVANLDKCKMNIPLDEDARTLANRFFAYQYNFELKEEGFKTLEVSQIPILNGGLDNFIAIYIVERSIGSNERSLATAFLTLQKDDYGDKIIEFDYWGGSEEFRRNQEILLQ